MMTHFLINKHTECFSLLKKYDAIGSNYSNLPHKHFSGNFWWATSNYINTLNKISIPFVRHDAEWWILSRQNVNYFELHNSGINHYQKNYPKDKYINSIKKSLHIFAVFHKFFYDELYSEIQHEEESKMITLYGVKERQLNTTKLNMIYEADLPFYNPNFQKMVYNEGSGLYHLYVNELYKSCDYIGFCQYDMKFFENTISNIQNIIESSSIDCIFNIGYFPDIINNTFLGGHSIIVKNINQCECAINSYNKFFNTNYTSNNVIQNSLIHCNTFVIPSKMFERMMSWMKQYFIDDLILNKQNSKLDNPGCLIEGLVGMFLSLEVFNGSKYYPLDVKHIWPLYKRMNY
jgi:hypothetical protein